MAKYIRVDLPIGSPDGTLTLSKKVSDKHTALGAGSPLTGFVDMTVFEANRANAAQLQSDGDAANNTAQSKYNQVEELCGIADGQNSQTKNTVYYLTLLCRDVLLLKHKGTEEDLQEYGFEVVISSTGARKNIRVDIPFRNPADLLQLADAIIAKHTALGAGSPLTGNVDMTLFGTTVTNANTLLAEWDTQRNLAQSKHNQALNVIGFGEGQTSQTAGTLYYDIVTARDRLLIAFRGAEEQMQEFGFTVVISSKRPGRTPAGSVIIEEGDVAPATVANIDLPEIKGADILTASFEATASALRFYAAATATDPPGATYLEVGAGGNVTLTPDQAQAEMGIGVGENKFLNVQNPGTVTGHYKLTVRMK